MVSYYKDLTLQPSEIEWKQIKQKGDQCPGPRSGHSLSWVGTQNYVLFGGIQEQVVQGKGDEQPQRTVGPSKEVFKMRLNTNKEECTWEPVEVASDVPAARSQHVAISVAPKGDRVFIFGGHHNATTRLNDTWWYIDKDSEFRRIGEEAETNLDNLASTIGAPAPRANSGACQYKNKIYINGGHGGLGYARTAFNDLYCFDLDTEKWEQVESLSEKPPPGRGGHSLFGYEDKIYVYGGWNQEMHFSNMWYFDLETKEWNDCDLVFGIPRWNHCSILVEAIPNFSYKFFIFGGESADYQEGALRHFGTYINSSAYLEVDKMNWEIFASDPEVFPNMPPPREYSAMAYQQSDRTLVLFGGWSNGWHKDVYTLNVSKVVGPSYAITDSEPSMGQLSGGNTLRIFGKNFTEAAEIPVYFTAGNKPIDAYNPERSKYTQMKKGTLVSDSEITVITPDMSQYDTGQGAECVVQLALGSSDITTTYVNFSYYLNTRAAKSLAYGPGVLDQVTAGHPVEFVIQARNDKEENRVSGKDVFEVKVTRKYEVQEEVTYPEGEEPPEDAPKEYKTKVMTEQIESTIEDTDDGKYTVKYTCDQPGPVDVQVLFQNDKFEMVPLRGGPYRANIVEGGDPKNNTMTGNVMKDYIAKQIDGLSSNLGNYKSNINTKDGKKDLKDVKQLTSVMENTKIVKAEEDNITLQIDQLDETIKLFQNSKLIKDQQVKQFSKIGKDWGELKKMTKEVSKQIEPFVAHEKERNRGNIKKLEESITQFTQEMKKREFNQYSCGPDQAKAKLDGVFEELATFESQIADFGENAEKFGEPDLIIKCNKDIDAIKISINVMKALWDHIAKCHNQFNEFQQSLWTEIKIDEMLEIVNKLAKALKEIKVDKRANAAIGIQDDIKMWINFLGVIEELASDKMRDRHWDKLKEKLGVQFEINDTLKLQFIFELKLGNYQEDVEEITDQAQNEAKMEDLVARLERDWKPIKFLFQAHKDSGFYLIKLGEDEFEALENDATLVSAMFSNRYLATFEKEIVYWNKALANIQEIVTKVGEVQRTWSFLENLFIHSDEVKKELPNESQKFVGIDKDVKEVLSEGYKDQIALDFCVKDWVLPQLEKIEKELKICETALAAFMFQKRVAFPRFFFVSPDDLLDILSNGNNPSKVMKHMPKIIVAIRTIKLKEQGVRPFGEGWVSDIGKEEIDFTRELKLLGKVECYLEDIIQCMRGSLKDISLKALKEYTEKPKDKWIIETPAQACLLINNCSWVIRCEKGFSEYKSNNNSVKEAHQAQLKDLDGLIMMVQGDLDKPTRQKIMCMITMDAHSRDILQQLIDQNVTQNDEFQWQTQLKGMYSSEKEDFEFRIADAILAYGYEYLGNGPRLVITPLTDRIYVTATQALHMKMGCAPAGPAGTGKTETTKDLANALAKACYVFNCSDQMDYITMANIFRGVAASGAWVCYDEFNRLRAEVLSVCATQFKQVCDAIAAGKQRFILQEEEIALDPTCGAFITMNPGYIGRQELPQDLKALFRNITVVVPDLRMIMENMLMAEGFQTANSLSWKFFTLYSLCKDLLSKAMHYDWGLRAIKSVLVVAGTMKRAEPSLSEDAILMRALRDFNTPKIVAQDLTIFLGLLQDLFPGINPERKRNMDFEKVIEDVTFASGMHPDPMFLRKVVELGELLDIRHCVFTMGNPGAGKSSTWKTLAKAQDKDGRKTTFRDINPKVANSDELYGFISMATREWKDGLLSYTMRALGQIEDENPKWIVFDGDLDATWIESMNSVMDDNKLLTLASNERIPLKGHMKMIFEIRDLRFATPATVSRAGILFISDASGYQWRAYVKSWIQTVRGDAEIKSELAEKFERYMPETLNHVLKFFKHIIPQVQICMVMSVCKLIQSILEVQEVKGTALEQIFVFSVIWCVGGGFTEKDGRDYRKDFSNWWKEKYRTGAIKFQKFVFDYYVDIENAAMQEWTKLPTPDITIDTSRSISSYTIPTTDTISFQYLMKKFMSVKHSPILVGQAGCGKTQIIKGMLNDLVNASDDYIQQGINFNYYTDANLLQLVLMQNVEKKAGIRYGPPGKYKLIYFLDDLNMPCPDKFDTQPAIALLRQHKDYEHWYDKQKILLMQIVDTQTIAAMNPTAGSFTINPRLQRHFWLLAVGMPENASLSTIYNAYLTKHFSRFKASILEQIPSVIKATLQLHGDVTITKQFRKTAQNFHYEFNVRHLTNVFQGILNARVEAIKEPENLIRLWVHEAERIYGDRLVNAEHLVKYRELASDTANKNFPKFNLKKYFGAQPEPLIFANFVGGLDEKLYDQFPNIEALTKMLEFALREYNDVNAVMNLVLFEDAMKHACKISRIIAADQGHALLVGVGGSGKQSLSRLSSFICSFATVGIMISSSYGMGDLKADLQKFYIKSGQRDEGLMFLFTEGQITNERFLVYLNDLLASGEVADLFAAEDEDGIMNAVRGAVKGEGLQDTKDNCMLFFYNRVRKNLHMALCFSPVGDGFRTRATRFPAIVTCTVIDWFHPWPYEALFSVAEQFLAEVEMDSDEIREGIVKFMPYSFSTVDKYSAKIMEEERRAVYTTPKSFLELINLFKVMLAEKKGNIEKSKEQYDSGVVKLEATQESVAALEENIKEVAIEVAAAKKTADEQSEIVGAEKVKVEAQNAIAEEEAAKCAVIKAEVEAQLSDVQKDLDKALPALQAALAALDSLKVEDFKAMAGFTSPSMKLQNCMSAVLNIIAGCHPNVPRKGGRLDKNLKHWQVGLTFLRNSQEFMDLLKSFKDLIVDQKVPAKNFEDVKPFLADPDFTVESLTKVSSAAAGLCSWAINIVSYYEVVVTVEPKQKAVAEGQAKLAAANEKKAEVDALVAKLNAEVQVLIDQYDSAMAKKKEAEDKANKCERQLNLASRLLNALGAEKDRWANSIIECDANLQVIIGDVLLASSFVSYVGPFNKKFRDAIFEDCFLPFFGDNNIPRSEDANPLNILIDDATKAGWNNNGLPPDVVSTQNGAILTNSERTTLMIDPQLQGIVWIRRTYGEELKVTRLSNKNMVRVIEQAVEMGQKVLMENMGNEVDAVIQPVYAKQIIKKGKNKYIKMGDKQLSLHNDFELFMHTKLQNPHYPPEIQAECTLINFTVTEQGLEDQLLSIVVQKERPDLAALDEEIVMQMNSFKIKLDDLEKGLLKQLNEAEGDLTENIVLIESLEESKRTSAEITAKVEVAKVTQAEIKVSNENYRPSANRGALVFFLMNELNKIHSFYKYSLDAFLIVVKRAIDLVAAKWNAEKKAAEGDKEEGEEGEEGEDAEKAPAEEAGDGEPEEEKKNELTPNSLKRRVDDLTESITYEGFNFTRRGTLEDHKTILTTMLTFRIMIRQGKIDQREYDALIKRELHPEPPLQSESLKFLPEEIWKAIKGLESLKLFENLISTMEGEALMWRKWYTEEKPESCEMPKSMRNVSLFHRCLLLRAMRGDRLTYALQEFCTENMGERYILQPPFDIEKIVPEMNKVTPCFFVLFPGVNPVEDIQHIAKQANKNLDDGTFLYTSMGEGQEVVADKRLVDAGKNGHWALFANVHLMRDWMKIFERNLEIVLADNCHDDFRCFLTSEPPPALAPLMEIIPESVLQNSLKVANEAPRDLKSNINRAMSKFPQADFDKAKTHKEPEFKALLFGLCMFHSLILGRKKFGSQGWSRNYDFNDGDLKICGNILHNYLSKYPQVPYLDLRYLFGEIMYGGHITDDWDRLTCNTYLDFLIRPEVMDNMQLTMAQGFRSPNPTKYERQDYIQFVDEKLPVEAPQMFGLHPNAEVGYLTSLGDKLCFTILSCSGGGGGGSSSKDQMVQDSIIRFLDKLPDDFNYLDISQKTEERTPYIVVCLQEVERMNILLQTVRLSLNELDAGMKGTLNISDAMEELSNNIFLGKQPDRWIKVAYNSLKELTSWFEDMLLRVNQLTEYSDELVAPDSLWISGLFNPMSYLTAILQFTARQKGLALDKMGFRTLVTNWRSKEEVPGPADDGKYIHGFSMQGAAWESGRGADEGNLMEMIPKELTPELPVMHVTAVLTSEQVFIGYYKCPAYVTSARGPANYITTLFLKLESEEADPRRWTLAGCALILQPE